jgi:hypothetical protein
MKSANHMNRYKSLQLKYRRNEIRIHKRTRIMILTESAVNKVTTPCAGSLELHTGPRCRLRKATGYSVNSAEYGTMNNVL